MSAEEWRPVPGHEGYDVSDLGRVRSWYQVGGNIRRLTAGPPHLLRSHSNKGYPYVVLRGANGRTASVHSLVLLAFVGPRPDGMETRHLDGDSTNSRADNLRYGTAVENARDKLRHGTHHFAKRTHCKNGHEFTPENTWLRPSPKSRVCLACKNARRRAAV